jgi:hypothetical protein
VPGAHRNYAVCFLLITSLYSRKRCWEIARYAPAGKRGCCGWKCPESGPKAESQRCACGAEWNRRSFFARRLGVVRICCSMRPSFVLLMLHARQDLAYGRSIALQLIGEDPARDRGPPCAGLAETALRRLLVLWTLHEDSEHLSLLIPSAPPGGSLSRSREGNIIQVPLVATPGRATTPFMSVDWPKRQAPLSTRFRGDDPPSLRQQRFPITNPERARERQPHRVAHECRGKTEPVVIGSKAGWFHAGIPAACSAILIS